MKANVGSADKVIRIILGVLIIGAGFYFKSWFGLIGIVPLLTAFMNFCPLYSIIGANTCGVKQSNK
ncbi:MAG: DUF2892 domain-containing protein [Ignavibacteria bacterium]|nr:DUF2892 domain-containing protein [Ignavibacteriales bacterium]MBN8584078.1 DUF2892 domain-containing protein [Ignavibacteria bacterium]